MESTPLHERFCLSCRHSLRGIPSRQCPECGREFDPDDPWTTARSASRVNHQSLNGWARVLVWMGAIVTGILFLMSATGTTRILMLVIGMGIGAAAIPPILFVWIVSAWPGCRLPARFRIMGILLPLVAASIVWWDWPLYANLWIHRPLFAAKVRQANGLTSFVGPMWVGLMPVREMRAIPGLGSTGFQLSGNQNGGMYLVHCPGGYVRQPRAPIRVWLNTNWEEDLGDDWFLVEMD